MPDIFISYSRKNKEFVQRVHGALAAQKRDIWVDWEDIPLTADWWSEICTGIEAADSVVVVITPESMASPICAMEIDHAIRHGKRLVPLVREMADEKTSFAAMAARELDDNARKALGERQILDLAKQNWNALARHNWLFFKDDAEFDATFEQLTSAVDTDLEHVKQHTRVMVRAREWQHKSKDASYLLSGTDIADAEKWIAQNVAKQPSPLPLHAEYISASRQAANRRQRMLLIGVSVAFVISLALTALSFVLFRQSEASRELADINAAAAVAAQATSETNSQIAVLNAATAVAAQATSDANSEIALFNASTAVAAQATAERRADESDSVALAQNAQAVAPINPFLAYALAIDAASIANPPAAVQQALTTVADMDAVRRFQGHERGIIDLVFTPDGQDAFSVSWDGNLIRWDVEKGQQIGTVDNGFFDFLTFSSDARYVALKTADNDLVIQNLETREVLHTLSGHESRISAAAFSGDGRYLISGSAYNYFDSDISSFNIIIWNVETGEVVQRLDGLEIPVARVSLNSDGRYAAYVLDDGSYGDTPQHMSLLEVEPGAVLWTQSYGYLSDMTFGFDNTIWLNPNDGIEMRDMVSGSLLYASSETFATSNFALDPLGENILFANAGNRLSLWNALNPIEIHTYSGHATLVTNVAISPDGHYALSGDQDGGLILWDLDAYRQRTFLGVTVPNTRAVIGRNQGVLLWTLEIGGVGYILPDSQNYWWMGNVTALDVSPDEQTVVLALEDATLWYGVAEQYYEPSILATVDSVVQSIAFSPDNETFLTGTANGALLLWTGFTDEDPTRFVEQGSPINAIAFSPDGLTTVSGADDGSVTVWNVATGDVLRSLSGHTTAVTSVAFSPDGVYLLTGDNRGTLLLWDVATGELQQTLNGPGLVTISVITVSPDSLRAAVGYSSGALLIWDIVNGTVLRAYLGHTNTVADIAFSDDGVSIYSIANDGSNFHHYNESLPDLINWFYDNREVPVLTCMQRLQYNAPPYCDESGVFPTSTPYPTPTPSVAVTATP